MKVQNPFSFTITKKVLETQYILFNLRKYEQLPWRILRYKTEGRGFDSRWCHGNFLITELFRPQYGPRADSASNRNKCEVYFLWVKAASVLGDNLTTFMCRLSWNLRALTFWNRYGLSSPYENCFTFPFTMANDAEIHTDVYGNIVIFVHF
jgi:hypothetical protein